MLYSKKEDMFLMRNYLTIPAKRMSKMLGRSESGARQMYLKKIMPISVTKGLTKIIMDMLRHFLTTMN